MALKTQRPAGVCGVTSATHPNAGPPAWVTKQRRPVATGTGEGDAEDPSEGVGVGGADMVGEPDWELDVVAAALGEPDREPDVVAAALGESVGEGDDVEAGETVDVGDNDADAVAAGEADTDMEAATDGKGCEKLALTQVLPATLLQLSLPQANTSRYTCSTAGSVHMASSVAASMPPYPRKTVPAGTPVQELSGGMTVGQVTVNARQYSQLLSVPMLMNDPVGIRAPV